MEFNINQIYKQYQSMVRLIIKDGYPLPYLIKVIDIPLMYDFTVSEKERLTKQMNDTIKNKLHEKLIVRRQIELEIIKHQHKTYNTLTEYYEKEILDYITTYPQFKNIIKK